MAKSNRQNIPRLIMAFLITNIGVVFSSAKTYAISPIEQGVLAARIEGQPETLFGLNGIFTVTTRLMLFAVGVLSILMIIVGGIRYITSGGKDAAVTKAKNTVLYAVIGLIVALLAYASINFIIQTLIPNAGSDWVNI